MAFPIPIIGGLFNLAKTWIDGRQKKQEAKDDRSAELIRQAGSWDEIQAGASANSWKDEYLTIIVSIPLIICFIPGCQAVVAEGFTALDNTPDWYIYTLSVVFAASFGVKQVIGAFQRNKK